MQVIYDERYKEFARRLSSSDQGRLLKYQDLFVGYGFRLPAKYLKKIDKNLWELRPGKVRLLLGRARVKGLDSAIFVHGFIKKSQKTPKKEIRTANLRILEYKT